MEQEERPIIVTYTYELPEHQHALWLAQNAEKMRNVLDEIYEACRIKWKHGDDEKVATFAEDISDLITCVDFYEDE